MFNTLSSVCCSQDSQIDTTYQTNFEMSLYYCVCSAQERDINAKLNSSSALNLIDCCHLLFGSRCEFLMVFFLWCCVALIRLLKVL